jgi:hypothetical protein
MRTKINQPGFLKRYLNNVNNPDSLCNKIELRHEMAIAGENGQREHFIFISVTNSHITILRTDTLCYQRYGNFIYKKNGKIVGS